MLHGHSVVSSWEAGTAVNPALSAQGKNEYSENSHSLPEATLLLTLTLSQDLTSQSQACWLPGSTASGPQNALRVVCAKEVSASSTRRLL